MNNPTNTPNLLTPIPMTQEITVKGTKITVLTQEANDYISLTDMLQAKDGDFYIPDWLRNRNTVDFLGGWEKVNNPDFNYGEFTTIRNQISLNSYEMSVEGWVKKTDAIGLRATAGRYGGTYAHKDIALEFGTWISDKFKTYLIKELQRLKYVETLKHEKTQMKLFSQNNVPYPNNIVYPTNFFGERRVLWMTKTGAY